MYICSGCRSQCLGGLWSCFLPLSVAVLLVSAGYRRCVCVDRCPLSCITPDVVEATCGCLLAQAEEAEREGHTRPHAERMILEEFGQCLTQIVRSIFKSTGVQW